MAARLVTGKPPDKYGDRRYHGHSHAGRDDFQCRHVRFSPSTAIRRRIVLSSFYVVLDLLRAFLLRHPPCAPVPTISAHACQVHLLSRLFSAPVLWAAGQCRDHWGGREAGKSRFDTPTLSHYGKQQFGKGG